MCGENGVVAHAVNLLNWFDLRPMMKESPVMLKYAASRDCVRVGKCRLWYDV